jgi:uncharacterized protein (DUF1778 family)
MPVATKESKSERIELRLTPSTKRIIQEAATAAHTDLSEFVLRSSLTEADIALSQRTRFVLNAEDWSKFVELLDRPATEDPALRRLLTEPSALER